ncbi:MAG: DinB family protein [Gammaproteobacteria bacterium]
MHSTIDHARTMASYNRWMNRKLYRACASLSDEARKHDAGAFFKSIHGTLNHLLLADRLWMGRFTGSPVIFRSLDEELYPDFAELSEAREREDHRIIDWAASLQEGDLDRELTFTGMVDPKPKKYPLWFAVTHFFNHQTHHRGQTTTLLSQAGVDCGVTDLLWIPEFQ